MTLKNINLDRRAPTIAGVKFPNAAALKSAASALASQMYEGFEPTPQLIAVYRDYRFVKIPNDQLIAQIKNAL